MTGITLDSGALIALERRHRRVFGLLAIARERGERVTVPAAVVAEWWRGQRGPSAHVLAAFDVEVLDERRARLAGEALARVGGGGGASTVDAIVMASAASRGDLVLTSDVADLERLRAVFPAVRVLGI